MKKYLVFPCFILFMGCSSTYVLNPKTNPKENAPTGYKPFGVVKYLNGGADYIVKSRREDAFKKMADSCDGKYKIISEGEKVDSTNVAVPVGTMWVGGSPDYWHITYECVQ